MTASRLWDALRAVGLPTRRALVALALLLWARRVRRPAAQGAKNTRPDKTGRGTRDDGSFR